MNKLTRFLILAILIFAAVSSYSYGNATGIFVFIILGLIFEGLFWTGLFSKKKKKE